MSKIVKQPKQSGKFRWIIERSMMSNNDEVVVHADCDITYEEFKTSKVKDALADSWSDPKLVFCRPVFEEELSRGLNTSYIGLTYDETCPPLTRLLDDLHKLVRGVEACMKFFKNPTPTNILSHIIAYSYYDCMSGGMPKGMMMACRDLVKRYKCDLTHRVYPKGSEEWYTLGDWMSETKDFDELLFEEGYLKGILGSFDGL